MKRVAIIPARGGSKRIPRKNIRDFHGKPIMAYPITAARASGLFDQVIVSTEDPEISRLAIDHGAHQVIHRPFELSDDHVSTAAVMKHAVEYLGEQLEIACCIYPCAPFIEPADLQAGLNILLLSGGLYCFPVTSFEHPVQRMFRVDAGKIVPIWPQFNDVRSQDLEPRYHDAGQWYWGYFTGWRYEVPIYMNAAALVLSRTRAIDIDTPEDWKLAEALYAMVVERVEHDDSQMGELRRP